MKTPDYIKQIRRPLTPCGKVIEDKRFKVKHKKKIEVDSEDF